MQYRNLDFKQIVMHQRAFKLKSEIILSCLSVFSTSKCSSVNVQPLVWSVFTVLTLSISSQRSSILAVEPSPKSTSSSGENPYMTLKIEIQYYFDILKGSKQLIV